MIFGPDETPFEGGGWRSWSVRSFSQPFSAGTFRLSLEFSEEYPNKPPVVKWLSHMFHPNGKARISSRHSFASLLTFQCMRTARSVWTFCRTSGAPSTTCRPFSPRFNRCSGTPTPILPPMQRPLASLSRTSASTASACRSASRRAGKSRSDL